MRHATRPNSTWTSLHLRSQRGQSHQLHGPYVDCVCVIFTTASSRCSVATCTYCLFCPYVTRRPVSSLRRQPGADIVIPLRLGAAIVTDSLTLVLLNIC